MAGLKPKCPSWFLVCYLALGLLRGSLGALTVSDREEALEGEKEGAEWG